MASCAIATLDDLITCLQAQVQGTSGAQTLTLDGRLFPAAQSLLNALGLDGPLVIGGSNIVQPGTTVVNVVGTAPIFAPVGGEAVTYPINIAGTVTNPGDTAQVGLVLTTTGLPTGWTFAANFGPLPHYYGYLSTPGALGLAWLPSFFYTAVFTDAVFTATVGGDAPPLAFSATLDLTQGALAPLGEMLPPSLAAIPVSGLIDVRPGTFPLILLASQSALDIAGVSDVGLLLATADASGDDPAASIIAFSATLTVGSLPSFTVTTPLLQGDFAWTFEGVPATPINLGKGLAELVSFVGLPALPLPDFSAGLLNVELTAASVTVTPGEGVLPTLSSAGVSVAWGSTWQLPMPGLSVTAVNAVWDVVFSTPPAVFGTFAGELHFGEDDDPYLDITVDLTAESNGVVGTLVVPDPDAHPALIDDIVHYFTGKKVDLGVEVTDFTFQAYTDTRIFFFFAELDTSKSRLFSNPLFVLRKVTAAVDYAPNGVSVGLVAVLEVVRGSGLVMMLTADYRGRGEGWLFTGGLDPTAPTVSVGRFINSLLPSGWPRLPAAVDQILLTDLQASYDTHSGDYAFATAVEWDLSTFADWLPQIEAGFEIRYTAAAAATGSGFSGRVSGSLKVLDFSVTVEYSFDVQDASTLVFRIAYQELTLACTLTTVEGDRVLTASLSGVTVGGVLNWLLSLVNPSLSTSWPPPWSVVAELSLDGLTLVVNLTRNTVGFTYAVNVNLGLIVLDTLSLTYLSQEGGDPTVVVAVTGNFFGAQYDDASPLQWDAVNEQPPSPNGNAALIELSYLGLGQNVALRDATGFTGVLGVIDAMETAFGPPSATASPVAGNAALRFAGNGQWLIGIDVTLMDSIRVAVVFNDPVLYGLHLTVSGEDMEPFTGLDVDVLYQKVSDGIGVYQAQLTLPEEMRQLELGVVTVTLPVIGLSIYTNGNFYVDAGFPYGMDFADCFAVEVGVFVGFGGLYFARLNGQTSSLVPQVTNGTFSPVIEFGVAVSAGLGESVEDGILTASASVTLTALAQGVLGWFNPYDASQGTGLYYLVQGTAALVAEVVGEVDLYVVKAEVSVLATAGITLTLQAYAAAEIQVTATVTVEASLTILFLRVHFSFSREVDIPFTLGTASTPPWIVSAPAASLPLSLGGEPLLRQQRTRHRPRRLRAAELQRLLEGGAAPFDWTPRNLYGGATVAVPLVLNTAFTVADGQVQAVMSLFVPNSIDYAAHTAAEVRRLSPAAAAGAPLSTPFNTLAAAMLAWAVGAAGPVGASGMTGPAGATPPVTAGALAALQAFLGDPARRGGVFTYANVATLMGDNFRFVVDTPLNGATGAPGPAGVAATVFPMVPELTMSPAGLPPVSFATWNPVPPGYPAFLDGYYDAMRLSPSGGTGATGGFAGGAPGATSLAQLVFADYFALVTRGVVGAARSFLEKYPHPPAAGDSLASLATEYGGEAVVYSARRGDTVATLAARFAVSPARVRARNPGLAARRDHEPLAAGTPVVLDAGPTPATIAQANANVPVATGLPFSIAGVVEQLQSGESLGAVAARFGFPGASALFPPGPSAGPTGAADANAGSRGLLRPGATMVIPPSTYTLTPGDLLGPLGVDPQSLVSARYFVWQGSFTPQARARGWLGHTPWYVTNIGALNPGITGTIAVPVAKLADGVLVPATGASATTAYTVAPGDTLSLIAQYAALLQLGPTAPAYTALRDAVVMPPQVQAGATVGIPALSRTVAPGDTLSSLAQRFGVGVPALAAANAQNTGLLQPLAVLALPPVSCTAAPGDTLATLAARYDLTLDQLADGIAEVAGIFPPSGATGQVLTIPDVPVRDFAVLAADMETFGELNQLSAMVSRFLLHGMRVPDPAAPLTGPTAAVPLYGLAQMVGQQFPAPPPTAPFTVGFAAPAGGGWIGFAGPSGVSGPTTPGLTVTLGATFLAASYPGASFAPNLLAGPTALPLYDSIPARHALQQAVHWQAATPVALPPGASGTAPPLAGQPTILMFPPSLLQAAAASAAGPTGPTPPYRLAAARTLTAAQSATEPLSAYAWATAVPLRVRQLPSPAGAPLSNSYLLVGADQTGRDLLLAAWSYLAAAAPGEGRVYLLYPPDPAGSSPGGVASDDLSPDSTFVLKTNLSTGFGQGAPQEPYAARISDAAGFLRYAWEASVAGGGGFYLNYAVRGSGAGLPAPVFGGGTEATLWLLLLLGEQSQGPDPARGLYAFSNCAVSEGNLDLSTVTVFAELADPAPADLQRALNAPAGAVGFRVARMDPGPAGAFDPATQTAILYSQLGYRIEAGPDFAASPEGLPVGPAHVTGMTGTGFTGPVWLYQKLVPVSRFGAVIDPPATAVLPPAPATPYRGITGPAGGASRPLSRASLSFGFVDVFGNTTPATPPLAGLAVPVGYTDPLVGVGGWPGAGIDYLFAPGAGGGVELDCRVSLQTAGFVPGGANSVADATAAAAAAAQRYTTVYYQVQQRDADFALAATLGVPAVPPGDLKAAMLGFVTRATLFTGLAARLRPVTVTTSSGDTLASLAAAWNVTPGMLAEANGGVPAGQLFAGPVPRPNLAGAPPSGTLQSLAKGHYQMPLPPSCTGGGATDHGSLRRARGPRAYALSATGPTGPPLTPAGLAANNAALPLTPGITLRTGPRPAAVDPPSAALNTIAAVARSLGVSPYATVPGPTGATAVAVGLVPANLGTEGLLAPGVTLMVGGTPASTTDYPTFGALAGFFAAASPPADLAAFVQASAGVQGIFVPGATAFVAELVVPPPVTVNGGPIPATLATLPAGSGTPAALGALNAAVPNLFVVGSPVYTDYACYAPQPGDTLATVASGGGVSLAQLGTFAQASPLRGGATLTIPSLATLPPGPCFAGAVPLPGDTLAGLAARFGSTAQAVAGLNQYLPGFFGASGLPLGGATVPVGPLDSLDSAWARGGSGVSFDQFVEEIAAAPVLRANGAVVVPLPTVPAQATLGGVAAAFGVDAPLLLEANRTLAGFLDPAGVVRATPPGATAPLTVTVGANGTVDSVIRAFAAQWNAAVTTAQIAAGSGSLPGVLAAGASFLLPPGTTRVRYPVAPAVPPPGASGQARVIFPIGVELGIHRATGLVAPDFAGATAVWRASSRVGPRALSSGATGTTGGATGLAGFAASFESAFAPWRLKCALSSATQVEGAAPQPQLYAVNFGPRGISGFALTPDPRFFALPPLSTQLVGGTALVPPYVRGCGLCTPVPRTYGGVDLDVWMQQLLSTVDLALSAPYAVPAFAGPTGASGASGASGCSGCGPATPPNGPANFAALVGAKARIAAALSQRVSPILEVGGTMGLTQAVLALQQGMDVQLGSAFVVDAIVGMPAAVDGPFGAGPAPRLSGKVVPAFYTVPAGGASLAAVGAALGVSPAFLAATLATTAGVLAPGATAAWGGRTATVGPGGTLAALAAQLGAAQPSMGTAGWAGWAAWTAFVEGAAGVAGIGGQPLLQGGAPLPLTRIARAVGKHETLLSFAEFLDTDPLFLGQALQDVVGLLPAGTQLGATGASGWGWAVGPTDSLAGIVAALDALPPAAHPVGLGQVVAAASAVPLARPQTLSFVAPFPDVTLSPAQVALNDRSWLTFLLGVRNEAAFRRVFLNLDFVINALEYDIAGTTGATGYASSSWLSFPLPIGGPRGVSVGAATSIPQIQVPLPLRVYPDPPQLLAQGATAAVAGPTSIAQARRWDYRFDFSSTPAAQDSVFVQAQFGGAAPAAGPGGPTGPAGVQGAVFAALAGFADALPALGADLAILPTLAPGATSNAAARAVQALAALAGQVAAALELAPPSQSPPRAEGGAGTVYDYAMDILPGPGGAGVLQLGFSGPSGPVWPRVWVQAGGSGGAFRAMTPESVAGATARYAYPAGVTGGRMTYRFELAGRDVAQDTTAWGGVWLTRNTDLVAAGPLGPTGGGGPVPTNPAFVYQTPVVRFVNPAVPLLLATAVIDIAGLAPAPGVTGTSIADHLQNLLYAAAGLAANAPASMWVEVTCGYGFAATVVAGQPLYAWMPVLLVPATLVGPAGVQPFAGALEASLEEWVAGAGATPPSAAFGFDLTLLTGSQPALTPVLRLQNLVLPFSSIDWPP